jgi:hypothetical protein
MHGFCVRRWLPALLAAASLFAAEPARAQDDAVRAAATPTKNEQYVQARRAFEQELAAYWTSIAEKRRGRNAKRRNGEEIRLEDYLLTQPPLYSGPPRPPGLRPSADLPETKPPDIPEVADFLKAAREQFGFVPERPSEMAFKRAYARAALAAGVTKDQAVRIYAFETGGDGTYDSQAGLTSPRRPAARAISPAVGYNQLLSTNSVSLLAEFGEQFAEALKRKAEPLTGEAKHTMERKIEALRRMITYSRSVPRVWAEQDKLAKTTQGGFGIHAAVLDRDLGPMLQTQKLLNSIRFAGARGYNAPLTATELELMNFTGDGNGFDLVTMPKAMREKVPTANFFQQLGYERNPIARRTGNVAALFASIDTKMDYASRSQGAKDLAAAFDCESGPSAAAEALKTRSKFCAMVNVVKRKAK